MSIRYLKTGAICKYFYIFTYWERPLIPKKKAGNRHGEKKPLHCKIGIIFAESKCLAISEALCLALSILGSGLHLIL